MLTCRRWGCSYCNLTSHSLIHVSASLTEENSSHSAPAQSGTEALSDHWADHWKPGEGRDSVSEIVSEALWKSRREMVGFLRFGADPPVSFLSFAGAMGRILDTLTYFSRALRRVLQDGPSTACCPAHRPGSHSHPFILRGCWPYPFCPEDFEAIPRWI